MCLVLLLFLVYNHCGGCSVFFRSIYIDGLTRDCGDSLVWLSNWEAVKVKDHRKLDPALKDIIFQCVFRQSVTPATPKEFFFFVNIAESTRSPKAEV